MAEDETIRFLADSPLRHLVSQEKFMAWVEEVGAENVADLLSDACAEHMRAYGTRSILPVAELIDFRNAQLAEHVDVG